MLHRRPRPTGGSVDPDTHFKPGENPLRAESPSARHGPELLHPVRRPEAYPFMGALLLPLAIPVMSSSTTAIPAATSVQTLLDRGRYADAELAARRLLRSQEGIHGSESLEAAEALDLLAESRISGRKA